MIDPRHPDYTCTPTSPGRPTFSYAPRLDAHAPRPAVSIVTPHFNVGPIFHETARCVLGQSLQNFEWVIVDDHSTDPAALSVLNIYRERAKTDPRIRVLDHSVNHGLPAARNTGLRRARAEYVFFLDGDDLIEPTTLEKCALFLACNPEFAFVKGRTVGFGGQHYLWDRGFHSRAEFLEHNCITATGMARRSVLETIGGLDETLRAGLEDWEFWLRCASRGHWGGDIPEYLDWYRRRPAHDDSAAARWADLQNMERRSAFADRLAERFKDLFASPESFPDPRRRPQRPFDDIREHVLFENPLAKPETARRLLLIAPWLRMGGADRFNLDLVKYLAARGWEITIATTLPGHPWLSEFTRLTPDVFLLDHLASPPNYPAILRGLIESRQPEIVLLSNSEHAYALLPFLRAHCPGPVYADFNHMEEEGWNNGGHPRAGVGMQDQLDVSCVVSAHLKRWMSARGADPARIEVCYINADTEKFKPDPARRERERDRLGIDPDVPVILYAVRLCEQKQPLVFAESVRQLLELRRERDLSDRFIVLVAGEGELRPQLERALDDYGLREHVWMLGPVPADRMPELMAASDIFFLPSRWEGIALSIYEAMSAGLAVVGADVGGQAELVTPETGILLPRPENDPEAEAAAYARVLSDLLDDTGPTGRRARMGQAARRRIAEHFELANMGRRMLEIFDRARDLKETRPRPLLSKSLARELAVQGVEMLRVRDLANELWPYREQWLAHVAQREQEDRRHFIQAQEELDRLETSARVRFIRWFKTFPPYRLWANLRYGENWHLVDPKEHPAIRVHRIRNSRSYRWVTTLAKSAPMRSWSE